MTRCPSCWSTVDDFETACPHCGGRLARRRRRSAPALLAAVLTAVAVSVTVWFATRSGAPGTIRPAGDIGDADRAGASDAPIGEPGGESAERANLARTGEPDRSERSTETRSPYHLPLRTGDQDWPALTLAGSLGTVLFLPLAALPPDGGFEDARDGAPLLLSVLTYDQNRGYVLARLDGTAPAEPDPPALRVGRAPAAGTAGLRAVAADGAELAGIRAERPSADGRLVVDRELPFGAVLIDAAGLGVGYALGGRQAIPLEPALAWVDQRAGRPLADVQAEIRSRDPMLLLADAIDLLSRTPIRAADARRGVEMLERGAALARDRATVDAFDEHLPQAYRVSARALVDADPAAAIAALRDGLLRYPDHSGLLVDAIELCSADGDPLEAADLYARLLARSPDHARTVADPLGDGLLAGGRRLLGQRRVAESLVPLGRAVGLFPRRADLRLAYADALAAAEQPHQALAEAREAVALDPSYAQSLRRFEAAVAGAGDTNPGRVEIPFDPSTHVIRAEVSVGGQPLSFVVDTGASMTTIPTATAQALGLLSPENRQVEVQTASGTVKGQIVRIPFVQIGELRLQRVEAVVLDLPNSLSGRGLLGMNVLGRTNLQIDSERSVLVLEKRSGRRRR